MAIAESLGLNLEQIRNLVKCENCRQRRSAAGYKPQPKGRQQYMEQKKHSVAFDVKTYLNGKILDYKTAFTNACARGLQRFR